jgi:cytochrome c556
MLPDFPKEKKLLAKFWNEYLARKNRKLLGVFATIPSFKIHEGDRWKISRSDGTESEQPYEEMSSMFTIELSEVPSLTHEKIRAKLDAVAEDAARQMHQSIFREILQVTAQVGNIVDAKGKPFTKESFLEALEKIDMEFSPDGQLIHPAIIMPPEVWKENEAKFTEWEQDKEFTARHEKIINEKREKWIAREALRKLVD